MRSIDQKEQEPDPGRREERPAETLQRRELLRLVLGCAAAGQLAALAACQDPEAVTEIPLARVPMGRRVRIRHQGDAVELLRTEEGIVARSLRCTHQKCEVFWSAAEDAYRCPCHPALFDPGGNPLEGPPTEPLALVPARIVGDTVRVGGPADEASG